MNVKAIKVYRYYTIIPSKSRIVRFVLALIILISSLHGKSILHYIWFTLHHELLYD